MRFDQLAAMTGGTLMSAERAERQFVGVSIDSRTLSPGSLFVALRGQTTDGHQYVQQAIEKGAAGVLSELSWPHIDAFSNKTAVVAVKDSHEAMMLLAERYRDTSRARFVGITGSNGKTTTKELTYRLVGEVEKQVYRSPGNFNNLYGMPLAIFAMPEETKVAVMEMGISVPGEMTRLSRMVKPDVICITNVGPSHLQFLKSVEGVAQAKLEMVKASPANTPVIVNADDAVLMTETSRLREKVITFGITNDASYKPSSVTTDANGVTIVEIEDRRFRLPLFGRHHVYNLLAAYAITRTLGYDLSATDTEALALSTAPMRGEVLVIGGATIIADCYNANPDSVRSALKSFGELPDGRRRVIMIGDMLELGDSEEKYHREIGELAAAMTFDQLVLVGPLCRITYDTVLSARIPANRVTYYEDAASCAANVEKHLEAGTLALIKGSRGIGLEKIITAWKTLKGEA